MRCRCPDWNDQAAGCRHRRRRCAPGASRSPKMTLSASCTDPAALAGAQVGTLLFEDPGQVVHRCYIRSLDRSSHRRRRGRRRGRRTPEEPNMSATISSLVIPVSDLDAPQTVYTALLGVPHTDQPYYVGYNVGGFEVALAPGDVSGGPVAYADVEDLDAAPATLLAGGARHAPLLAAGATERSAPRQVAPEARVCVLADADGNPIGLRGQLPAGRAEALLAVGGED